MKYVLALTAFFSAFNASAQTDAIGAFNKHIVERWTEDYIRISQYRVKGTVYLLGEPFKGDITYANGTELVDNKLLYDTYHQKAGPEVNGAIMVADVPVSQFVLRMPEKFGGQQLLFKEATQFGKDAKGYYNVLFSSDRFSLLKQFRSKLISDPSDPYSKDIKLLEQYYEYYVYVPATQSLKKVKLKEKDLQGALGVPGFAAAASQEGLNLSVEGDVVQLMKVLASK